MGEHRWSMNRQGPGMRKTKVCTICGINGDDPEDATLPCRNADAPQPCPVCKGTLKKLRFGAHNTAKHVPCDCIRADPALCGCGPQEACEQCYVDSAPDHSGQGVGVAALGKVAITYVEIVDSLQSQLAAANAEIARLKQQIQEMQGDIAVGIISQQSANWYAQRHDLVHAPLIAALTDALREATEYVRATHASIKGAVGHDNVVLPVLNRCEQALALAEKTMGGE